MPDQPNRYCLVIDCDRTRYCRGWCRLHYQRWQRHGDPTGRYVAARLKECSVEGCAKAVKTRGWCSMHAARWRIHSSLEKPAYVTPARLAAAVEFGRRLRGNRYGEKHGLFNNRLYRVWSAMHQRCENRNHRSYRNYGGRGISVCERWSDVAKFVADMGEPPVGLTLDRIDNDGNYEPCNCRWATVSEQNRNQRRTPIRPLTPAELAQAYRARKKASAAGVAARNAIA